MSKRKNHEIYDLDNNNNNNNVEYLINLLKIINNYNNNNFKESIINILAFKFSETLKYKHEINIFDLKEIISSEYLNIKYDCDQSLLNWIIYSYETYTFNIDQVIILMQGIDYNKVNKLYLKHINNIFEEIFFTLDDPNYTIWLNNILLKKIDRKLETKFVKFKIKPELKYQEIYQNNLKLITEIISQNGKNFLIISTNDSNKYNINYNIFRKKFNCEFEKNKKLVHEFDINKYKYINFSGSINCII